MANEKHRRNITNSRKFKAVVTEMEVLLGEFKCLMDGCLDTTSSNNGNDQAEAHSGADKVMNSTNDNSNITSAVDKTLEGSVTLSPELARAYEKPLDTRWNIKEQASIHTLYQQFFNANTEEQERRYVNSMLSLHIRICGIIIIRK